MEGAIKIIILIFVLVIFIFLILPFIPEVFSSIYEGFKGTGVYSSKDSL